MNPATVAIASSTARPRKSVAWFSVIGAVLGILAGVVVALNLLVIALHFAQPLFSSTNTRTAQERAMLFVTGSACGEFLALVFLWRILRRKGDSLARLGLWKRSGWPGWVAGLAVAAYSVIPAVRGLHIGTAHLLVSQILFEPTFFHLYTALLLGCGAGLCEEIFFRGYIMTRLADAGYGWVVQVLASAVLFGVAHGLYGLSNGLSTGLDIMAHTAVFGGLYAIVYLLSRRSLMPCILSHFLNDAIVLPWVFLQMFHPR